MKTVLIALTLLLLLSASGRAQTFDDQNRITVTGDAAIDVAPDRIVITFGVDTRNTALIPAKQHNDSIVGAALAALKQSGILDSAIQTDRLSIAQQFNNNAQMIGYIVRNMFTVTLNDPARVESVITTTLNTGVNYLLNVDFQTTALKQYREQARELAVKAAREKAEKMAAALGQTVRSAIAINENQSYNAPRYYSSWSGGSWDGRATSALSQNVVQAGAGDADGTVALGKVTVRAAVNITFALTP